MPSLNAHPIDHNPAKGETTQAAESASPRAFPDQTVEAWHDPLERSDNPTWLMAQRLIAAIALVLLSPLFALLWVMVKASSKGPFLFAQDRPGLRGAPFKAYKIRSMYVGADKDRSRALQVSNRDPMVTPLGHILRHSKLDELPQLFNVMKGEMVLVGPRPIAFDLQNMLERTIPGFRQRLMVRPGLTSLAQVCIIESGTAGDIVADWRKRFAAEHHYLINRSVAYDAIIIALTLLFLVRKVSLPLGRRLRRLIGSIIRWSPKHTDMVKRVIAVLLTCAILSACAEGLYTRPFDKTAGDTFARDIDAYGTSIDGAALEIQPVRATPADLTTADHEDDGLYRVGIGDRLAINIFGEPGLEALEVQIDKSGIVQLPFLEPLSVLGKTALEIQAELRSHYSGVFKNPWVIVDIKAYRSRPINLLGRFNNPGVYFLDGPTDLLRAISFASGIGDGAYLRGARLWRNEQVMPVDIFALLEEGRTDFNLQLRAGDTIYVPSVELQQSYMLGAVVRPGAVVFSQQPMTLLKALSEAGGAIRGRAMLSQVRIIRTLSATDGQLILVNVRKILSGHAPDVSLRPDDVVYVPQTFFANWNDALAAITPSLQAAGGVLQPFVQLKFLKGDS